MCSFGDLSQNITLIEGHLLIRQLSDTLHISNVAFV